MAVGLAAVTEARDLMKDGKDGTQETKQELWEVKQKLDGAYLPKGSILKCPRRQGPHGAGVGSVGMVIAKL
jgi:hypothetical protein